jgi:hypothetical protein
MDRRIARMPMRSGAGLSSVKHSVLFSIDSTPAFAIHLHSKAFPPELLNSSKPLSCSKFTPIQLFRWRPTNSS